MQGWLIVLCMLLGVFSPLSAEEVRLVQPGKPQLLADYRPAQPEAPALLILHGFLVTGGFPTVQALAGEFAAKGYSVLAPTLSLGITGRRAGLACDAIHTHTLEQDLAEIGLWVDWLARRTKGPIILVGHSFGSVQLLAYARGARHSRVAGLIGMSMSFIGAKGEEIRSDELARAEARLASGNGMLDRYSLIYCHGTYTATPMAYLSYARLERARVLEWLKQNRLPLVAIMGGADQRFGDEWVASMRESHVSVRVVPGASHFFEGTHEFDLLDMVDSALGEIGVKP